MAVDPLCRVAAVAHGGDFDVVECGKLTGLSCAGDFEIQTAAYKTGETYTADTPLKAELKAHADAGRRAP